ncbi:hypothetical protein KCP73_17950 [Salmonella enterica subsp. enterica]|nr:hypothetical protein KCP73_17950 [Salmonella enterica subsp. enterica]
MLYPLVKTQRHAASGVRRLSGYAKPPRQAARHYRSWKYPVRCTPAIAPPPMAAAASAMQPAAAMGTQSVRSR